MNTVILQGNLGQEPQIRYTGSGKAVSNFSITVNYGKDENKKTDWFPIVAWGELAELSQQFKKGNRITVTGRLQNRKWTDKKEVEHTVTEIVASSLAVQPSAKKEETAPEIQDEDIPF